MKIFVLLISLLNASAAFAQDAAAAPQQASLMSMLPLVLIFFVFYFLVIRPQSKKMKEHRQMVEALRRGDQVITGGGVHGTVKQVHEGQDLIEVEIAKDVVIKVVRSTVVTVIKPVMEAKKVAEIKKADVANINKKK